MLARTLGMVAAAAVWLGPVAAAAAEATTVLTAAMACPMSDPPVLRRLLQRLPGVVSVTVRFEERTVTVVYDDALSTPDDFLAAYDEFGIEAGLAEAMPGNGATPATK